jgi:hypothetical protein
LRTAGSYARLLFKGTSALDGFIHVLTHFHSHTPSVQSVQRQRRKRFWPIHRPSKEIRENAFSRDDRVNPDILFGFFTQ